MVKKIISYKWLSIYKNITAIKERDTETASSGHAGVTDSRLVLLTETNRKLRETTVKLQGTIVTWYKPGNHCKPGKCTKQLLYQTLDYSAALWPPEKTERKKREESCNHFSFMSRTVVEQQNQSRENAQLDELKRERDQSTCREAGAAGARGAEHGSAESCAGNKL